MEVTEPDGEISVGLSVSWLQEPPLEETKETWIISSLKMFQRNAKESSCECLIRPVAYGLLAVFVTLPFAERLAKATGKC